MEVVYNGCKLELINLAFEELGDAQQLSTAATLAEG